MCCIIRKVFLITLIIVFILNNNILHLGDTDKPHKYYYTTSTLRSSATVNSEAGSKSLLQRFRDWSEKRRQDKRDRKIRDLVNLILSGGKVYINTIWRGLHAEDGELMSVDFGSTRQYPEVKIDTREEIEIKGPEDLEKVILLLRTKYSSSETSVFWTDKLHTYVGSSERTHLTREDLEDIIKTMQNFTPKSSSSGKLTPEQLEEDYGFNAEWFNEIQQAYKRGDLSVAKAKFPEGGVVTPYSEESRRFLPVEGTSEHRALSQKGGEAIAEGKLAVIALNGGIATRFRGASEDTDVKGLFKLLSLPSHDPSVLRSFMELKLAHTRWARQHFKGKIPQILLDSYFTDADTRAFLATSAYDDMEEGENLFIYNAGTSKRIIPTVADLLTAYKDKASEEQIATWAENAGQVFQPKEWIEGYNPAGHGEAIVALFESGLLDKLIDQGVEYLWFSNIDNLGGTIDPAILGELIESDKQMLTELAEKYTGDKGGAPALVNGRMQLVEQFAMPSDLDQSALPDFNPATYVVKTQALKILRDRLLKDLPVYVSMKEAQVTDEAGNKIKRPVAQFERLLGDLTAVLDSTYLTIDREKRFFPIKSIDDLDAGQNILLSVQAEGAEDVEVYVDGEKLTELTKQEDGTFSAKPFLKAGSYLITYRSDGINIKEESVTVKPKRDRLRDLLDQKVEFKSMKSSSSGIALPEIDIERIKLAAEVANLTDTTGLIAYNDMTLSKPQREMMQSLIGEGTQGLAELEAKLGCKVKLMSQNSIEDNINTIIISTEDLSGFGFKSVKHFRIDQTQIDTSYVAITPLIAIAKGLLGLSNKTDQPKLYTALKTALGSLSQGLLNSAEIENAITAYINGNPMFIKLPPAVSYDYDKLEQLQRQALLVLIAA